MIVPTTVNVVWEECHNIAECEKSVATVSMVPQLVDVNVITIHDVKTKCSNYSYVTINGHPVKVKQDTGAEVNVMSEHIFNKLGARNTLNKVKTTNITGYGQNPIEYTGTCVFSVKHNNVTRDMLFFVTNVDDTKVILGSTTCQAFNLVKVICDDDCQCKKMKLEVATVNEDFPVGLSIPNKMATQSKLPPVDVHTKIDKEDPKGHILHLYPDLFDGVGTMENVLVHLDIDKNIEPVVQALHKIPHSMLQPLKSELERMMKIGVIHKLHINEATDWVHNLVLVRKPNGKLHVCLDPCTINKALHFNIHNARTFPEITSKIKKVEYISKIDANSGFWMLPMDAESQLLTTFNTPWGRFCFLKMPFGLNQSQYFFQFWMDAYFGDLNEGTHDCR